MNTTPQSPIKKTILAIFVISLVAVATWLYYTSTQSASTEIQPSVTETTSEEPEAETTTKEYSDSTLGITFSYPKSWLTLKCEGRDNVLYLGSDTRGLGMQDGKSILCGGGTDFAPQGSFYLMDKGTTYEGESEAQEVKVGGVKAYKYFDIEGEDSIREEGFETTQYFVERPNGVLVITYSEWPTGSEGYDTTSESKAAFTELVESSLRFN